LGYSGSLKNKKVLITCGPTWVAIDPVRVISNISSGELAHNLTRNFLKENAKITLLQGPVTDMFSCSSVKVIHFKYLDEFSYLLKQELKKTHYDVVVHAAAVSDYELKKRSLQKIKSNLNRLQLQLVPTQKLISTIKRIQPKAFLVGFKLETSSDKNKLLSRVKDLTKGSGCDLVLGNIINKNSYQAFVVDRTGKILAKANSRAQITSKLIRILKDQI